MIGGLIIDALVLLAVILFVKAGRHLGGLVSLRRLIASLGAIMVVVLIHPPFSTFVHEITGGIEDVVSLLIILVIGVATFFLVSRTLSGFIQLRAQRRAEWEKDSIEYVDDPLDQPKIGAIAGGVLGLVWVSLFVSIIILTPRDAFYSRAAVSSITGKTILSNDAPLRWLVNTLPHFTQTLPKGRIGAVVGEQAHLSMVRGAEAKASRSSLTSMMNEVNIIRRNADASTLVWNPEVAEVAERHAVALANNRQLVENLPGGGSLESQVYAALGAAAPSFESDAGILLAWAHSPVHVATGLIEDSASRSVLTDPRYTEIGIGIANAGWFNGNVFVLVLLAPRALV